MLSISTARTKILLYPTYRYIPNFYNLDIQLMIEERISEVPHLIFELATYKCKIFFNSLKSILFKNTYISTLINEIKI